MSLSAVILAGGKSSRMGEDKALLPYKEFSTLVEYQYIKLKDIFNNVYISSKNNKFPFKSNIITDEFSSYSPLGAIISSLEYIKDDIFILSVDMPLIDKEIINKLVINYKEHKNSYDIFIAKSYNGLEPTVAIYTQKSLKLAYLQYRMNDYKLLNLIKKSKYKAIYFKEDKKFININFKEDYKKLLNLK